MFVLAGSNSSIRVLNKGSSGQLGLVSVSVNVSIIIDAPSNLATLMDGDNGSLIFVDYNSNKGYKLLYNDNTSSVVWRASTKTYESFFANLTSLKPTLEVAKQYNVADNTSLPAIGHQNSAELKQIFGGMGVSVCNGEAFDLLTALVERLRGKLGVLYKSNASFTSSGGFQWYAKVNLAFSGLLNSSSNSSQSTTVNLGQIFSASSGFEAVIRLFGQLGQGVDLTKLFPNLFTNQTQLLDLIGNVSGGSNNGLDGLITILVNIAKFLEGHTTLQSVFDSVVQYNATIEGDTNITSIVNEVVGLVENQNKLFNNSQSFHILIEFVKNLNSGCFVWNKINLSDIVKLLSTSNSTVKFNILIEITKKIAPKGINELISYSLKLLNSTQGVGVLLNLIPGLGLSNLTGSGNILGQLVKNYNLTTVLSGSGNITAGLSNIPVIGCIIQRISSVFGKEFQQLIDGNCIVKEIQHICSGWLNIPTAVIGDLTNATGVGSILPTFGNIVQSIGNAIGSALGLGNFKSAFII